MKNVWMEVRHRLIYKNKNLDTRNKEYLEELYSVLTDLVNSVEHIILLADKFKK